MAQKHQPNAAVCQCGKARLELTGAPIESLTCYCESCRNAGHAFEQTPGAPKVVNAEDGVDYCLYRKDRVRIAEGGEHLREHRLKPDSPTRRVVAECCGSPMFVDFVPGHWLTVYRDRLTDPKPELHLGVMTRDRPEGPPLPAGIPNYPARPPGLMFKLLGAWAGMGFRRVNVSW